MSGTIVNDIPQGKVGCESFSTIDLVATAQTISAVRCNLFSLHIRNRNAAERFVRLYNLVGATVASTPTQRYAVPAQGVLELEWPKGLQFGTACSIRGTTGIADNDAAAPSTNDLVVNASFKPSVAPVV